MESLITKTLICPGKWGEIPGDFSECKIKIMNVAMEGTSLEQYSVYFRCDFSGLLKINDADCNLDRLLEMCVQTMTVSEVSHFKIKVPSKEYQNWDDMETSSLFKGVVECTVELIELHHEELIFEWTKEKKHDIALDYKERGVKLYREGCIEDSFYRFSKAFKIIVTIGPTESLSENSSIDQSILFLRLNILSNMASCQLSQKNYAYVMTLCSKVLKQDPKNVKALYKRAVAAKELQNYESSENDLKALLEIEPNNTAAKERLQEVKEITKEMNERYAKLVKNMFK